MQKFSNRAVDSVLTLSMDVSALIPEGATISGCEVTASVFVGSLTPDPSPSAILDGAAALVGNIILQRVTGGVVGCTYVVTFKATFSTGDSDEEQALQTVSLYVP